MIIESTNFINWTFFCTLDNVHAILFLKNSYELLRIIFMALVVQKWWNFWELKLWY